MSQSPEGASEYLTRSSVVEIGFGTMPFVVHAPRLDIERIFYTGIESVEVANVDGSMVNLFSQARDDLSKTTGLEFNLLQAKEGKIQLPDRSVDIVHIANVMGDYASSDDDREFLMAEISRILKNSGILRVIETMTPDSFPLEKLIALANYHSLMQLNNGREHDLAEIRKFVHPRSLVLPNHYIALFSF